MWTRGSAGGKHRTHTFVGVAAPLVSAFVPRVKGEKVFESIFPSNTKPTKSDGKGMSSCRRKR